MTGTKFLGLACALFFFGGSLGLAQPPTVKLSSLELWSFRPDLPLAPVHKTKSRGTQTHKFGPAYLDFQNITEISNLTGLRLHDGAVEVGWMQVRQHIDTIYARSYTTWKYPKVSWSGVGLKSKTVEHPIFTLRNVSLVVSAKRKLSFHLPDKIELQVTAKGKLEFANRPAIVAALHGEVDRLMADAEFDHNFKHWLVNVTPVGEVLVGEAYKYFRPRILAEARAQVKAELDRPEYLDEILDGLNRTIPISTTDDFHGLGLVLEKWSLYAGEPRERLTAWRLRPADQERVFSDEVMRQIPPATTIKSRNGLSMAIHAGAMNGLFQAYLRNSRRDTTGRFPLPLGFKRDPVLPMLTYSAPDLEAIALGDFFRDFDPSIGRIDSKVGVYTEGEQAPEARPWYSPADGKRGLRNFVDLVITFAVWERGKLDVEPHKVRLAITFSANRDQVLRLENVRTLGLRSISAPRQEEPPFLVFSSSVGNRLKFLMLQSIVNQRLELVSDQIRSSLKSRLPLIGLRLLGDLGGDLTTHLSTSKLAEAVVVDFEVLAQPTK